MGMPGGNRAMMEVLESFFGPGVGLIGFAVMVAMILPKFIVRWRGFRARRRGSDSHIDTRLDERELTLDGEKPTLEPHARFGEARLDLQGRSRFLFVCGFLWIVPLLFALLMPASWDIRNPTLICAVPLACLGLWRLRHVFDHTVFYRTGFVQQIGFKCREIDYNAVVGYRKRASVFPDHASTYIFLIEDESPIIFDGNAYFDGGKKVASVIKGLAPRKIKNSATEVLKERAKMPEN